MTFVDWVTRHARVASKKHARASLDDMMNFFHQLATLVGRRHATVAVDPDRRDAVRERLQSVLEEIALKSAPAAPSTCRRRPTRGSSTTPGSRSSAPARSPARWPTSSSELNRQVRRRPRDEAESQGGDDLPDRPALRGHRRHHGHARFVVPTFDQDVQGDGGRAARRSPSSSSGRRTSSSPMACSFSAGSPQRSSA